MPSSVPALPPRAHVLRRSASSWEYHLKVIQLSCTMSVYPSAYLVLLPLRSHSGCLQDGAGGQQRGPAREAEPVRHCHPHATGEHSVETCSAATGACPVEESEVLQLQQRCQLPLHVPH